MGSLPSMARGPTHAHPDNDDHRCIPESCQGRVSHTPNRRIQDGRTGVNAMETSQKFGSVGRSQLPPSRAQGIGSLSSTGAQGQDAFPGRDQDFTLGQTHSPWGTEVQAPALDMQGATLGFPLPGDPGEGEGRAGVQAGAERCFSCMELSSSWALAQECSFPWCQQNPSTGLGG